MGFVLLFVRSKSDDDGTVQILQREVPIMICTYTYDGGQGTTTNYYKGAFSREAGN